MKIDKNSYKLPNSNFYQVEYTKKQIVVGHTGRNDMSHYSTWINRYNGKYKKSVAFTIDKEGGVYQHYDPKYYSDYVDKRDMGPFTIPITLVNLGWVTKDNLSGKYYDWFDKPYIMEDKDLTYMKWRNKVFWVNYTEEQLKSLKKLTDKLCDEFGIKNDCISHTNFNEDVDIYEGIVFKSNYYQEVTDISPAFNMDIFKN